MTGWEISLGTYTGILVGIWSSKFENGHQHCLYLPFVFIELNTYYDTNFTNEQGKMENVMKKSKCLSKIPQSEMGNVKLEQKRKQKEEEYKNAKLGGGGNP